MTLQEILAPIQADLERVERELKAAVDSKIALVPAVFYHTLEAGGKRLRPALAILSGHATGPIQAPTYHIAVAVELIHIASLIHDDAVDDAGTRRGRLTAHRIWGNKISILVADYLLASAYTLLSCHTDASVLHRLSLAIDAMCEGELAQLQKEGSWEVSEAQYLEMIANKTGALMAIACELGAYLSGAPNDQVQALSRFGLRIGTAFQVTDDLLDLAGEEEQIGKPVGNDLRNGRLTLPLIHALQVLQGNDRKELLTLLSRNHHSSEDFQAIRRRAWESGGVAYAQKAARSLVAQGKRELEHLPLSEARTTLGHLADYMTQRQR